MRLFRRNRKTSSTLLGRSSSQAVEKKGAVLSEKMPFFGELGASMKVDWASLGKGLGRFQMNDAELEMKIKGVQCKATVSVSPMIGKWLTLETSSIKKPLIDRQKIFSLAERLSGKKVIHSETYASSEIHGVVPVGANKVLVTGTINYFEGNIPSVTLRFTPTRQIFGKIIPWNSNIATIRYSEDIAEGAEQTISLSGQKYIPGSPNFAVLRLIEEMITK